LLPRDQANAHDAALGTEQADSAFNEIAWLFDACQPAAKKRATIAADAGGLIAEDARGTT
jgi:hypothetical protein